MSDAKPQEVTYGNLSSSKIPALKFITTHFLHRLAKRCELGNERKGDKAYNALSPHTDQDLSQNIDFAIERCSHILNHTLELRDKLAKVKHGAKFEQGDDDAGALAWNAMYLCEVTRTLEPQKKNCSACGGTRVVGFPQLDGSIEHVDCPACKGTGQAL